MRERDLYIDDYLKSLNNDCICDHCMRLIKIIGHRHPKREVFALMFDDDGIRADVYKKLSGPYGHAIWKIMEARMERGNGGKSKTQAGEE